MNQNRTLLLIEVAMFAALALLLDFLSNVLFSRIWPQGGSVSIAMVPIFLMAYRWGLKGGMLTGFLLGVLQVIIGPAYIVHPIQGLLDYFLAFTVAGFAGVFYSSVQFHLQASNRTKWISYSIAGVIVGGGLRFACHVAAGAVFFAASAPKGQPVILYSMIYNATYMLPSLILSSVVVILVLITAPKLMINHVGIRQ